MARRRIRAPKTAPATGYVKSLRRVWGVAQGIIAMGLEPLLAVWPSELEDSGASSRGPLSPRPLLRRIRDLSDPELRVLWPGIPPDDIRAYAPWAVSREEVERLVLPAGRPIAGVDLEAYVRAAINEERRAAPRDPSSAGRVVQSTRPRGAFRLKRLPTRVEPPPVIYSSDGVPIGPPPTITKISSAEIKKAFGWIDLALQSVVTEENLSPILDARGKTIRRHTSRALNRVLPINLREAIPGLQPLVDEWRDRNIDLIESGLWADREPSKLRPSLLADVSSVVERAHAQGLRVEYLAGELQDSFGISDSRAELIARDQILKLNGQLTQHRQRNAGITQYEWSSSQDSRTRKRHRELDGTIQSWDSPPEVAPGRHEHPGGDYQCRCTAIPILPAWMTESNQ